MPQAKRIGIVIKRDGTVVDYSRERIATAIYKATVSANAPNRRLADRMAAQVERALIATYALPASPSVEDVQDVVERILMSAKHIAIAKRYIIYRHERAMIRATRASAFEVTDNVPYRKIYDVLRWNMDHNCDSVDGLNRIIRAGDFPALVHAADQRYNDELKLAAQLIAEREEEVRLIIVAGPSSSGKTTTASKLEENLAKQKRRLKTINIDHYFFDLATHPRDEFGDYDYETPQALDLALIDQHLKQLLAGHEVRTPHYDFQTGRRTLNVHPMHLKDNDILVIDSLHGLHDDMTSQVPDSMKFKLYIETLSQFRSANGPFMRWADTRLLRRMNRDKHFRNLSPLETLRHWHYVRRSELSYIIPFLRHADFIVNSALPYELPILRAHLFRMISTARRMHADDPHRLDAHIRANRIYELLQPIRMVTDETCIPDDSLLREFIGGSRYAGH